ATTPPLWAWSMPGWWAGLTKPLVVSPPVTWQSGHRLLRCTCPLMAQSRHPWLHCTCPLSGVKRTWRGPLGGVNVWSEPYHPKDDNPPLDAYMCAERQRAMSEHPDDQDRPCLHCMMVELIDEFFR